MQVEQEVETYWDAGYEFDNNKEYQKAAIAYSRAIRFNQNLHEVYTNWASTLFVQNNFAASKQKALNAIKINPLHDGAHYIIGRIHEDQEDYPEAEARFREAIKVNPLSNMSYFSLASVLDELKRYEEAELYYAEAARLDPGNSDTIYMWAVTLYNQMKYEEAAVKFEEATVLNPFHEDAYVSFGLVLSHQRDWVGATGKYQRAVDVVRNDPERIDDVIKKYEDEIVKSEKKLFETSGNEAKMAHFEREIGGMKMFFVMLREEKRILKKEQMGKE